jgi:acyl-CoA synthetase (AMP-forming)/AMP-acid ligase II
MASSLVDSLLSWESQQPDQVAYRYLVSGDCDGEIEQLTYRRLGGRARAIAAWLQDRGLAGSHAMLLHPPGLEFICAYLGCLLAGVVAVPGVPPRGRSRNHRALLRMRRLVADADARVILGGAEAVAALAGSLDDLPELAGIDCVDTAEIPDEVGGSWREPDLTADSIAFLQYTSGSTSAPRGVMVTHRNLMANQRSITEGLGHTPDAIQECGRELFVSWLPMYHDMGLIGPVLNTVYLGVTATLLSPLHFLQKPERWLTAISRFRPHTSGGPNFAYDLCARAATPELLDRLDLGSWRLAFNGSEPVRAATLRRFASAFSAAGFRYEAFYPCYGLAEATLMVSGGPPGEAPTLLTRTGPLAPAGAADAELVSCGAPGPGITVVIVDPERGQECAEGEPGEIWVAGDNVARGYWRNALATRQTFRAALADGRSGFLRTGDQGLLRDGRLFVTGRLKDLIVIDGRNHHPQDLELSVEMSHPMLRTGCTAAFSVESPGSGEEAVIVAEATAAVSDPAAITARIRSAISEGHGLALRDVVLVEPGTIPKTSSGKIQRRASRAAYLEGKLAVIGRADGPTPVGV